MHDDTEKKGLGGRKTRSFVVLIIEDDVMLSKLYSDKFRFDGLNALVANDGRTGLELATEKNPDAILLDMMLPGFSGFRILEELQKHPRGKYIPVICLTNLTDTNDANRAYKFGVKEYLAKAMHTPESVVQIVKDHLPR